MRTTIIFIALLSLPSAMVAHWLIYEDQYRPHLISKVRNALRDMGIRKPDVSLTFLDAAITGIATSEENRTLAAKAVREIRGIRLADADNRIIIPAALDGHLEDTTFTITGWLPDDGSKETILKLIQSLRPDVTVMHEELHASAHVRVPEGITTPFTRETEMVATLVQQLRIPAEFSLHRVDGRYVLAGHLPDKNLRDALIAVVKEGRLGREVDATELNASEFVDPAAFTAGDALAKFLRSYCAVPEPGDFSIQSGTGPVLAGAATRELEAQWLSLLRPLSGTYKVESHLSIRPSRYHLPGYEATSTIPAELLARLQENLRRRRITFAESSMVISPEDTSMLYALTADLFAAGPALHLIIGSHPNSGSPSDRSMAQSRAEAVHNRLVELGIPAENLHMEVLDDLPIGSTGGAETGFSYANSVELIVR